MAQHQHPHRVFTADTCQASNNTIFTDISSATSKHPNSAYRWCGTPSCKCFSWENQEWNFNKRPRTDAPSSSASSTTTVSFGPPKTILSRPGGFEAPSVQIVQLEERLQAIERFKAGVDSRMDGLENRILSLNANINELKGRVTSLEAMNVL